MVAVLLIASTIGCSSTPYVASEVDGWQSAPAPSVEEVHRVYLLGDIGGLDTARYQSPVLAAALASTIDAPAGRTLVVLGDNVYCCGLPDSTGRNRHQAEQRLDMLLDFAESFGGPAYIIPGNHDWNDSRPGGAEYVRRMEDYVESRLGYDAFLPSRALPGPETVEIADDLTLVAIDTEWWLTRHERPFGETGEYEVDEDLDFVVALNEALNDNEGDRILLVGHHPIRSVGPHNGRFPPIIHLFPLTRLNPKAYVPLPVLGSMYVLASRVFGGRQDLPNRRYRALRSVIEQAGTHAEQVIYAAGHEHSLQYFRIGSALHPRHHIVSGSASRPTHVGGGGGAIFTAAGLGYSTLHYYADGAVWASFWLVGDSGTQSLAFRTQIESGGEAVAPTADIPASSHFADSVHIGPINPDYAAGAIKSSILGRHNRELWTAPVAVPVLDLGSEAGGLIPIKRGGGMQTVSLRLEDEREQQYDLRSLDKDPSKTVPVQLQGTVATDFVQDQISSIDPYGAFVIPPLARAVGIYHTRPRLVYVPDDPRLGRFRDLFANEVMMIEHRPDDDVSAYENFGHSDEVVDAAKLYEELREDNDDRIDARAFLRARIFDMLISDWDRHRGQWRWARFDDPDGNGNIYRPIPRDRDWAFNRMNGFISVVAPYFDPKFQAFNPSFGNIKGLTMNGLEQDRRFLAAMTREDWVAEATAIRDALAPEVIAEAVNELPEPIRALDGERIRENLNSRLGELVQAATDYYGLLAQVADIVGTDKHERFEVIRHPDGDVTVRVSKTSKEGEFLLSIYERLFLRDETEQVRLFGLGGRDDIRVSGRGEPAIEIIAVGGAGEDAYRDETSGGSGRTSTFIDTPRGTTIDAGATGHARITDDPYVNTYDPFDYRHDVTLPLIRIGSGKDEGLVAGGGILVTKHGFRKQPFAARHRLSAAFSTGPGAVEVNHASIFTGAFGSWDISLSNNVFTPGTIRNFFGLGNERDNTVADRRYYQARLGRIEITPAVQQTVRDIIRIRVGPYFQVTDVRADADRYVTQDPGVSDQTFEDQWFGGIAASAAVDAVDFGANPRQGLRWTADGALRYGLANTSQTFGRIASDVAFYVSPLLEPQVTMAIRAGVAHNIGPFPFYEANTLGGSSNLRGHRSTRYAGRTAVYQNTELRIRLFRVSSYVAQGGFGVLGFVDVGRVWTDGEASRVWHAGYGGGAWLNVFNDVTLVGSYGLSADDEVFEFGLGFQY